MLLLLLTLLLRHALFPSIHLFTHVICYNRSKPFTKWLSTHIVSTVTYIYALYTATCLKMCINILVLSLPYHPLRYYILKKR
jgi:hypothetical protein